MRKAVSLPVASPLGLESWFYSPDGVKAPRAGRSPTAGGLSVLHACLRGGAGLSWGLQVHKHFLHTNRSPSLQSSVADSSLKALVFTALYNGQVSPSLLSAKDLEIPIGREPG